MSKAWVVTVASASVMTPIFAAAVWAFDAQPSGTVPAPSEKQHHAMDRAAGDHRHHSQQLRGHQMDHAATEGHGCANGHAAKSEDSKT